MARDDRDVRVIARARRIACATLYYGIARHLPATISPTGRFWTALRAGLVRGFVSRGGRRLDISRGVYLGFGRGITIGDDSGLGIGAEVHGPLSIGSHVMISPGVLIHTRNHEFADLDVPMGKQGYQDYKAVTIEDDVWIGARAIILPGVTIGTGSIVGAGSVLAKSVPPYSIVVGNPARVVKSRVPRE